MGGSGRYGRRHRSRRSGCKNPWYRILYIQVLIAIVLGVIVGWLWPNLATNDWIKALGDGFIKLIRMLIAPIIFCTVVSRNFPYPGRQQGRPGRDQGSGLFRDRVLPSR